MANEEPGPSILYARYIYNALNKELVLTQKRIGPSNEQIMIRFQYGGTIIDKNFQPISYDHHSGITKEGREKIIELNRTLADLDARIQNANDNPIEGASTFSGEIPVDDVLYEAATRAGIRAISELRGYLKNKGDKNYRVAQVKLTDNEKLPPKVAMLIRELIGASSNLVDSLEGRIERLRT